MDKPINPLDFFHKREQYEIQRAMRRLDGTHAIEVAMEVAMRREHDAMIRKAIERDVSRELDGLAVKKQVKKVLSKRASTSGAKGGNSRALKFQPLKDWATEQPTRKGENPHAKATRLYRSVPSELIRGINDPVGVMDRAIRKALTQK